MPRTKVEVLRKGSSRRDEVGDRAATGGTYRAIERGTRYNVEAGGISKAWPHTPAHVLGRGHIERTKVRTLVLSICFHSGG